MKVKNFFKKLRNFIKARYAPRGARQSFAGSGEDLIISDLLKKLKTKQIFYIDIGAGHPVFGNNTYLFYKNGGYGVLVEPNAELCEKIRSKRPKDICINAGAGRRDEAAEFYSFKQNTRSTFSQEEANAWQASSGEIPVVGKHETISLDTIINRFGSERVPDLVSIDTEGYELEVLSGFSWTKKPKIFCIETVASSGKPNKELSSLLEAKGYKQVAKTQVNSIFIDSSLWL